MAIFATQGFKDAEPALAMIVREACASGSWFAVTLASLKSQGTDAAIILKATNEAGAQAGSSRIKCFTGKIWSHGQQRNSSVTMVAAELPSRSDWRWAKIGSQLLHVQLGWEASRIVAEISTI